MADYTVKKVGEFPAAISLNAEDVLFVEQYGKAKKLSGELLEDFCREAISEFTTRAETAATEAEAAKNAAAEIEQLIGEKAGVASFNGRAGIVVPQSGDYTAAMVGAAPAGYGLGGAGTRLTSADDLNNVWQSGYYYYLLGNAPANAPSYGLNGDVFVVHVIGYSSAAFYQEVIDTTDWSGVNAANVNKQVRTIFGNKIKGWYWDNPPMKPGIEYCTTERYDGKPVYVMTFSHGAVAAGDSVIIFEKSGLDRIIRYTAELGSHGVLPWKSTVICVGYMYPDSNGFNYLVSSQNPYPNNTLTLTVWYTKTTD